MFLISGVTLRTEAVCYHHKEKQGWCVELKMSAVKPERWHAVIFQDMLKILSIRSLWEKSMCSFSACFLCNSSAVMTRSAATLRHYSNAQNTQVNNN